MRRTLLTRHLAIVAILSGLGSCVPAPRPPSGADCHPTTAADLRTISDGDVPCDWMWIVETELEDLEGLRDHQDPFEGVVVAENGQLRSLGGLLELADLTQVSVNQNAALTELNASWQGIAEIDLYLNRLERISLSVSPHFENILQVNVWDEPVTTLEVTGSPRLTSLNLSRLPGLSSLSGLMDVETVGALKIQDVPQLTADELDSFLARLNPAPGSVEICGTGGRPAC